MGDRDRLERLIGIAGMLRNASTQRRYAMPLAKIHVLEGRYDEARIAKVSAAVQSALMNTLRVPPEDFYQLIFEMPKNRLLHTPSFVGMHYTDDLFILDVTFIQGRSKETRLALLKRHQHASRLGGQFVA
jgi:phenylpyruvate tautomerase PptA (4-oxalocrotonate tautomerase family)